MTDEAGVARQVLVPEVSTAADWLPWLRPPPLSTRTVPANVSALDASG
jgi:hypothetical protein